MVRSSRINDMMNFDEIIDKMEDKSAFLSFLNLLRDDLENDQKNWTNITLAEYLEAMSGWVEDMEGYYLNNGISIPENVDWKVFANILVAAKMYE